MEAVIRVLERPAGKKQRKVIFPIKGLRSIRIQDKPAPFEPESSGYWI